MKFLADRIDGHAHATVLRPSVVRLLSVVCDCGWTVRPRAKVTMTAYEMSYMRNRLAPKWVILTFV